MLLENQPLFYLVETHAKSRWIAEYTNVRVFVMKIDAGLVRGLAPVENLEFLAAVTLMSASLVGMLVKKYWIAEIIAVINAVTWEHVVLVYNTSQKYANVVNMKRRFCVRKNLSAPQNARSSEIVKFIHATGNAVQEIALHVKIRVEKL
jgi:hypothetical protein